MGSVYRLTQHLKWSLRFYGLSGTLANGLAQVVKRSAAQFRRLEQRCQQYKERCFDSRLKIDTSDHVPLDQLEISEEQRALAVEYAPTSPVRFCQVMAELGIHYGEYVFVDLGSGKGRVLLLASEFPFQQVIGVEIDPRLHHIAQKNIAAYQHPFQKCEDVQSICSDVTRFPLPEGPAVLFLFNPFKPPLLKCVVEGLRQSLLDMPRHVLVLYFNPLHRQLFDTADFLIDRQWGDKYCAVYETTGEFRRSPIG